MKVYGTDNLLCDSCGLFNDLSIMEVIGNVHENRDLIENADFKQRTVRSSKKGY